MHSGGGDMAPGPLRQPASKSQAGAMSSAGVSLMEEKDARPWLDVPPDAEHTCAAG